MKIYGKMPNLVIKTFGENNNIELGYNAESVEWLDGFIERQRVDADDETIEQTNIGSGFFSGRMYPPQFRRQLAADRTRAGDCVRRRQRRISV